MSEEVEMEAAGKPREFAFQAEVNQVLNIVINSLYSHREIFLRELLSNAADALDKLRFQAIADKSLLGDDTQLAIEIVADKENRQLIISDNGIGMTRDEMIENLGTIAHSGSKKFLEAAQQKDGGAEGVDLIGQFGVGFYSSFLVADEVKVYSKSAQGGEANCWSSKADGNFCIDAAPEWEGRGTQIILALGEEHQEYSYDYTLRQLIKKYSDYIGHPIKLQVEREEGEGDDKTTHLEFETVNKGGALWKRPKSELDDEQYAEFYKHITQDFQDPAAHIHFKIEGGQMFTGLLFVPSAAPFDLFDRDHRRGVRLYVKRVFIMDDCEELIPVWLRFIRGIIDSDDLPLNVSRELLQEDKVVRNIQKQVVKKVLSMLEKTAKDDAETYRTMWENFGVVLKEGIHFDHDHRDRLASLARFTTTAEEYTSLDEYIERMQEDQDAIYYVMGPSRNAVEGSPHTEALRAKGIEVIYMTDSIDEWAIESLGEYQGKRLISAMRAGDLEAEVSDEEKEKREEVSEDYKELTERMASVLGDQVEEVRLSNRLTASPCCLVIPEGGLHAHVERMLRMQNKDMPASKRILELNPDHQVIGKLKAMTGGDEADLKEWIFLLYDQALLAEGSPIPDPPSFAKRMAKLMGKAMS